MQNNNKGYTGRGLKAVMTTIKPVRENNAIDEIAFAVKFTKQLDDANFDDKLNNLAETVKEVLPKSKPTIGIVYNVNIDDVNGQTQTPQKRTGIVCYKPSKSNKHRQEWALRVEADRIIVACSEYTSWSDVSKKAKDLLLKALKIVNIQSNPIMEISYQCIDKFESPNTESTPVDLFNIDSIFLTKKLAESNKSSWHIHQGWFTKYEEIDSELLNNLNINRYNRQHEENGIAVEGVVKNETVINHLIRIQNEGIYEPADIDNLTDEDSYLSKAYNKAHNLNKEAIQDLLNDKMLLKIGLNHA
jgi:hypothetical protein